MKRNILESLILWKNSPRRKPLILDGARQVGKTWILQEFGKLQYQNTVYFNCDKNEPLKAMFEGGFDSKDILRNIEAISGQDILDEKTLIIFDEVQECPKILAFLKYFCEDLPKIHVAAAGSLLGLSVHSGTGFPVGKVDILKMYPMTFGEFVNAYAGEKLAQVLLENAPISLAPFHETFVELLRKYYFVGGMPEAVNAFAEGKSFSEIRGIQSTILYSYSKDMSKHAPSRDIARIHQVWDSIPKQLAKENRKFIYGAIKSGARAKDFEMAIQWLLDAGLVYKVNRISKAGIPLKFYEDMDAFKLFMLDCGLMGALSEAPAEAILTASKAFEEYKGAFTEQYVMQQLVANIKTSIFYYSAEDSKQELDFIMQKGEAIVPIEVKAEENLRAKSLRQFVLDHEGVKGVRISMSPYREQDWLTNYPLYAIAKLI